MLFYLTWSTELPVGEPCKKANQLAKGIAEVWKGMSNAQKKEAVTNGRSEVKTLWDMKVKAGWTLPIAMFNDTCQVLDFYEKEVSNYSLPYNVI